MTRAKRISIWAIALVGLMTVTSAAKAGDYDFKSKGVYYKKNGLSGSFSRVAKVVPEKASYPYYTADANKPTGDISIPRTVTERKALGFVDIPYIVTEIGDYAFYGCKGLKRVTIPSSLSRMLMDDERRGIRQRITSDRRCCFCWLRSFGARQHPSRRNEDRPCGF